MKIKRLLLIIIGLVTVCFLSINSFAQNLSADGRLSPGEGYSAYYWVTFPQAQQDGSASGWVGADGIGKALLALGTDPVTGNHFMYYALPKGYVDNTYDISGNNVPPVVGTYNGSAGHKLGVGLIGSDQFGITGNVFELKVTDPNSVLPDGDKPFRMTVDYLADVITNGTRTDIMSSGIKGVNDPLPAGASLWQRRDGSMNRGDDSYVLQIATSMEWNIDTYGPTGTGDITAADIATLSGYLASSPDVVRDSLGPDPSLAVLAADSFSYIPADSNFADWIYEVAYEFEFHSDLFGPEWGDPTTEADSLMVLGNPHASPYKGLNGEKDPGTPVIDPMDIADLSLVKYVNDEFPTVGDTVIFTITVTNDGPSNATGVTVTDQLPSGYTYVNDNVGSNYVSGSGLWTIGELAVGQSVTLNISASVNEDGDYFNVAEVTTADQFDIDSTPNNDDGDQSEDDEDNAEVTPSAIEEIDISLLKAVNDSVAYVDSTVTFTITVSNAGPGSATNVAVADTLPSGFSYNAATIGSDAGLTGATITPDDSNAPVLTWTIDQLDSAETVELTFQATVNASGEYTNMAQVTAHDQPDIDSTPDNNVPSEDDQDDVVIVPTVLEKVDVSKSATTSITRTYSWNIEKTAVNSELTLSPGQTFGETYGVKVSADSSDVYAVSGKVTIVNNTSSEATISGITDELTGGIAVVYTGTLPQVLSPGDSLVWNYYSVLPDTANRTNTVTVATSGSVLGGTASAGVNFASTVPVKIDECIEVSDDFGTPSDTVDDKAFGTVCADVAPKTFTYVKNIGPYTEPDGCGDHFVTNIASYVTVDDDNDTGASASDTLTIKVTVPCETGCSLTPGYWKTHSQEGPAPYDDTWALLSVDEEDTPFFLSGQTYYQVLWTSPQGNAYYILAHAYIAAELNFLNGSDATAAQSAFVDATALFENYTPEQIATAKGKNGKELRMQIITLATTLDDYNNGLIGPGHCSEESVYTSSDDVTDTISNDQSTNEIEKLPESYSLEQNYPNPFNPTTSIRFNLPETNFVSLRIFNSAGQLVKNLVSGSMQAGSHNLVWDATDDSGLKVVSGIYFYQFTAGSFMQTNKMVLLK